MPDIDTEKFRLRSFVDGLIKDGQVEIHDEPVPLSELAGHLDGNPKAVLFRRAGPEAAEVVGNVIGSRERLASAFGIAPEALARDFIGRLRSPQPVVELASGDAPAHQIILDGDDADFTSLPVHLQHALDGGPYISAGVDFATDPETGWTNVGSRRLMLRGRREAGINLTAPSDLRVLYQNAHGRAETLPVSFAVGSHPSDIMVAAMRLPVDEIAQIAAFRTETLIWNALQSAVAEPVAVYSTATGAGVMNARVSLRQRVPGEARNAIAAIHGSVANVKNIFVVDDDIDVFSDAQIDWALATRFQPDRDLMVASGFRTLPHDPSLDGRRTGAKAGYDLTLPFGRKGEVSLSVPEPPSFDGPRHQTVLAALEAGPATFGRLMAAVGSDDGREVVLALDELRRQGRLTRIERGDYALVGGGGD